MLSKMFSISVLLAALLTASTGFAKNINLYEQPKADAKIVGVIDPAAGIVPIYTPKQSEWVKIGDPRNGNVGWVKSNDLLNSGTISTGFSISQQLTNDGKKPESFLMQIATSPELTPEQSQRIRRQIEEQQIIIQNSMQQLMQDIYNDSGIFVPIVKPVVAPAKNTETAAPKK